MITTKKGKITKLALEFLIPLIERKGHSLKVI